ncbi:MAG: type II toxin-antitoxin system HicA family toxin [Treponema sp.]|nr:type II toxin-antitoxin system HicA family toxin [Treponema sp.]
MPNTQAWGNHPGTVKKGFVFKSQKGSHAKYTNGYRTVIIPMHNTVARGTLKSILIHSGIELEEFLKLL